MLGPGTPRPRHRRRRPRRETVPTSIRQLLNVLEVPAFVEDRYFDVLAANSLARSLSPCLQVGQNRLRAMSLDPAEKALYPHRGHAARLVPSFREPWEAMPTAHVTSSSSANCRCPANDSDGAGPGTTFSLARVYRPRSTTLKSSGRRYPYRASCSDATGRVRD